jgi:16S rRNA processing protein RimM
MTAGHRVCVAQIGGPHGVRGEVKLKSFTADPMAVKDYAPLESEDGVQQFEIAFLRPGKGHLVAQLTGIRDRSAAERITNLKLFVPRERLPKPEPEEFYHFDLIGAHAVTPAGEEIGTVHAIYDFGAGDILELRLNESGATVMVPFTTTSVPEVDIAGSRIVVVTEDR